MAIVDHIENQKVFMVQGMLGAPNGLGLFKPAWSKMGYKFRSAAIYRRDGRWDRKRIIKCKHYRTANPRTTAQQANRTKLAGAVAAWHALSDSEKQVYRKRSHPPRMTGYCRFVREYMLNN